MTLIAVHYAKKTFTALSDSRVSHSPNGRTKKLTDYFTKLFILPYRFCADDNGKCIEKARGEVGFAFAGDITIAMAIQAMSTNILQNMYDQNGTAAVPSFADICEIVRRSASMLHEETVFDRPRCFEAFIFGFCPMTSAAKLMKLTTVLVDGLYQYAILPCDVIEGAVYSAGSGAKHFAHILHQPANAQLRVTILFQKAVRENPDPATGGAIQMLTVNEEGASHRGVLQASDDKERALAYLGGVEASEFGEVAGYVLGRVMVDIGASEVANRESLRRLGYDPDSPEMTDGIRNTAAVLGALHFAVPRGEQVALNGTYWLDAPKPQKGSVYFACVCKACFRLTPLLIDERALPGPSPFTGTGSLRSTCVHCSVLVELRAQGCRSQVWR